MAIILDGRQPASELNQETKRLMSVLASHNIVPTLAILMVGEDRASEIYIRNKQLAAQRLGIDAHIDVVDDWWDLEEYILRYNEDDGINGIIVQLPIPDCYELKAVLDTINPLKDIDGLTSTNLGHLTFGEPRFIPAAALGIFKLLSYYGISTTDKHVVIYGKSNIVGKPLVNLLINDSGTVTWCHRHTPNLRDITIQADVLIVAAGKPNLITSDMVKEGVVVIDVGISRISQIDGHYDKIVGDVDFGGVSKKASAITPVPGGVGPMTIATLLHNTVLATFQQRLMGDFDDIMHFNRP